MSGIRDHCNLSDEALENRRKDLRKSLMPRAKRRQKLDDGIAVIFGDSPNMREQLDDFVAFEGVCCSGLEFSVAAVDGSLRLEVRGIDPDSGIFDDVPASEIKALSPTRSRGAWLPVLRSAGAGSALALILCCVVPFGAVALVGATVAAPLVALDNPFVIAPAAVLIAALLWRRDRKRNRNASIETGVEGCGC